MEDLHYERITHGFQNALHKDKHLLITFFLKAFDVHSCVGRHAPTYLISSINSKYNRSTPRFNNQTGENQRILNEEDRDSSSGTKKPHFSPEAMATLKCSEKKTISGDF